MYHFPNNVGSLSAGTRRSRYKQNTWCYGHNKIKQALPCSLLTISLSFMILLSFTRSGLLLIGCCYTCSFLMRSQKPRKFYQIMWLVLWYAPKIHHCIAYHWSVVLYQLIYWRYQTWNSDMKLKIVIWNLK